MALVIFEVESLSKVMTNMDHMSFERFAWTKQAPWGRIEGDLSRAKWPVNVQCEPKDKSKLVKEPVAKIVRLEASYIGGKLAREVKAAHMNILQAVIY